MVKSSIEEESLETPGVENSKASMASASTSGNGSDTGDANAVSTDQVELNSIEQLPEDDDGIKSEENGDIAAEKEPLRPKAEKAGPSSGSVDNIDEEEGISKDDLDSDEAGTRKKGWDMKCVFVGLLILVIMVGGAAAAILVHRFKGKPTYEFRFASYYQDHMVLQRAPQKAVVWGYGPILVENTTVKITVHDKNYSKDYTAVIRNDVSSQVWKIALDPMTSPGPFTITAKLEGQEGHEVSIQDVLFGDVWVCAGQNNMMYSVDMLKNATAEIKDAEKYESIRLFAVFPTKSDRAFYDLRDIELRWSKPSAESLVGDAIYQNTFISTGTQSYRRHFSALCWLYGKELHRKLQYPVGLVVSAVADTTMQEWASPRVAYEDCQVHEHSTSTAWNAMINSLLDMSIYGAIMYQGENDGSNELPGSYDCLLINMVKEWREEAFRRTLGSIDPTFPLGIVQLGPNGPYANEVNKFGFAEVRWHQTANYGYLPNENLSKTFLAVTMDLPDEQNNTQNNIYSSHKHTVAQRLVQGALAVAYRQDKQYQGPFPVRYRANRRNKILTVYFDSGNLERRMNDGFEMCCSGSRDHLCLTSFIEATYVPDRSWISTPIRSVSSASVDLDYSHCERDHVVGLRYAWREAPCPLYKCALYDAITELPVPPYIKMGLIDDGEVHDLERAPQPLMLEG